LLSRIWRGSRFKKAAEGRRTPRRFAFMGTTGFCASFWSAPALWRFFMASRGSGDLEWTTGGGGSNVGRVTGISGGELGRGLNFNDTQFRELVQIWKRHSTMKEIMKEIIEVRVDKECGTTEVLIRVPHFENFGQRLGELERKASEAIQMQPEAESSAEIEAVVAAAHELRKKSLESLKKLYTDKLNILPDGHERKMVMQALSSIVKMENEPVEEDDEQEVEAEQPDKNQFVHDLQPLRVSLPEKVKWNKATEAQIDNFLTAWPTIRPLVLNATFRFYRKLYPKLVEIFGVDGGYELTIPKPMSADVVADLFLISSVYFHEDGSIGLGGHCTWDDEHGYGVRINKGKITKVGYESEAFD
jgi:hypothetical protein